MLQLNKTEVVGRITHNLELREGDKGPYLNFQVAVPREWRKDQKEQKSDFIDAVAFNSTAEFINKYFGKGSPIYLEGKMRTGGYEDDHGNTRKSYSLVVREVKFMQTKKEAEADDNNGDDDDRDGQSVKSNNYAGKNAKGSKGKNSGKSNFSADSGKGGGAAKNIPFDPDDDDDLPF